MFLVFGSVGNVAAHPGHQGQEKAYHCHATNGPADNGDTAYNLLHLSMAAASKNNVHGAVEIHVLSDGTLLCPDDGGYDSDDAEIYTQKH